MGWLVRRCGGHLPAEAFAGAPFSTHGQLGANPIEAVRGVLGGNETWAARLDFPDADVPQRTWVTEIVLQKDNSFTNAEIQLTNVTRGQDASYQLTVPGLALQLLSVLSVSLDGISISEEPWVIDRRDVAEFVDLTSSSARKAPIVAVSTDSLNGRYANTQVILKRLAGAAHIVRLTPDASWALTDILGKQSSVFNGAVRIYLSGFGSAGDTPFRHRLWLNDAGQDEAALMDELADVILPLTFSMEATRASRIRFADVKEIASASAGYSLRDQSAQAVVERPRDESIPRLLEENKTKTEQIERMREDEAAAEQLLIEADQRTQEAITERDAQIGEAMRLRARVRQLEGALRPSLVHTDKPLTAMVDFESWAEVHLSGRIVLLPRAVRETRKSLFHDPPKIGRTLILIRDLYVGMRRSERSRDEFEEVMAVEHLEDRDCFEQKGQIKDFPEYRVSYKANKYWMDRHFKFGSGYDERYMFRIYYFWDEDEQVIVIGHMPSHLDNRRTS